MKGLLFWASLGVGVCLAIMWRLHPLPGFNVPVKMIAVIVTSTYVGLAAVWTGTKTIRWGAGPLLLDCGQAPWQKSHRTTALYAVVIIAFGCVWAYSSIPSSCIIYGDDREYFAVLNRNLAFGFLIIAHWISMILVDRLLASGSLELRERGIWNRVRFIPWNSVACYNRYGKRGFVFVRERMLFSKELTLLLPPECAEGADAVAAGHCRTEKEYLLARADAQPRITSSES